MKVNSLVSMAAVSVMLLGLPACSTVNSTEHATPQAPRQMVSDKRVVTDNYLNDHARIVAVNESHTPTGLLQVQVEVLNTKHSACHFRYTFEWLGASGMLLPTSTPSYISRHIQGGESMLIQDVAPAPEARDFRLKLIAE